MIASPAVGDAPMSIVLVTQSSPPPPPPPPPPLETLTITGSTNSNAFLTQVAFFNTLVWSPPALGTPLSYNIYRDERLIASVDPAAVNQFIDYSVFPNVPYTYRIEAIGEIITLNGIGPIAEGTLTLTNYYRQ